MPLLLLYTRERSSLNLIPVVIRNTGTRKLETISEIVHFRNCYSNIFQNDKVNKDKMKIAQTNFYEDIMKYSKLSYTLT